MKEATVADGSEQSREGDCCSEDRRLQIKFGKRDGLPGPEKNISEGVDVFPESHFAFGAAVKVIEHDLRQPPSRSPAEIIDIYNRFHRDDILKPSGLFQAVRFRPRPVRNRTASSCLQSVPA